jgi:hypothetical protein
MGDRRRYRNFVWDSARWDGFVFRDGDIVISTPPKCGTTWMQMLCAVLIFRTPELPAPLSKLSPWLDMNTRPLDSVLADLDAQSHRRFIKTHTPLDGLPWDDRVTYIHVARDPRDAALSWDSHMANMDLPTFMAIRVEAVGADDLAELGITGPPPPPPDDPAERFWQWIEGKPDDDEPFGMEMLAQHAATFWVRRDEPNVHLFHYGDLRADLRGEMARLADALGVDPPDDTLVEAATFEAMKARADDLAPNTDTPFWRSTQQFFDRARSGDWRAFITDDDSERRYEKAVAARVAQDLADWLHGGWRAGPGAARRK